MNERTMTWTVPPDDYYEDVVHAGRSIVRENEVGLNDVLWLRTLGLPTPLPVGTKVHMRLEVELP